MKNDVLICLLLTLTRHISTRSVVYEARKCPAFTRRLLSTVETKSVPLDRDNDGLTVAVPCREVQNSAIKSVHGCLYYFQLVWSHSVSSGSVES